ncbi:SDR family oxidoreductase [Niveispirillum sp.]|uniref:SDR family NAD(P)-dependent oxidoreductase n=1 Tax=Niveispirillum sp. TaxID=1917217 RepID=UPI001B4B1D37|nr:SDR family oxidoreductase [Niveispirillum sp.]MBP7338250.1 SDR family oxidoreductase [Niveispirillum sp.]
MSRLIIVTGGSRGLGLAITRALLEAGYSVATCSRSQGEALPAMMEACPDRLFWQEADIGNAASSQAFIDAAVRRFGAPWGLVNNAGIAREGILATLPLVEVDLLIQTNLSGAIQVARAVLRHMLSRPGGGRIINISSIIGQRGYTGLAAYAATKAGLDGLTRALAREVGRRQITVNSVAPGYLDTEMSGTLSGGQRDQIVRRTPLGRLGTADDVVPSILFLLGDGARFITGQTLTIDGGITC